jgi:hypothetical protein
LVWGIGSEAVAQNQRLNQELFHTVLHTVERFLITALFKRLKPGCFCESRAQRGSHKNNCG